MKVFICNAFSLSMLDREAQHLAVIRDPRARTFARTPRPVDDPVAWLAERDEACLRVDESFTVTSAIGHPDTARILSLMLGRDLPVNRVIVKLDSPGVHALIGQYIGPRLPEGATTLPEGARIEWWSV